MHHAHGIVKVRHGNQRDIRNSYETETCQHAILFPSRSNRANEHAVSQRLRDRNPGCRLEVQPSRPTRWAGSTTHRPPSKSRRDSRSGWAAFARTWLAQSIVRSGTGREQARVANAQSQRSLLRPPVRIHNSQPGQRVAVSITAVGVSKRRPPSRFVKHTSTEFSDLIKASGLRGRGGGKSPSQSRRLTPQELGQHHALGQVVAEHIERAVPPRPGGPGDTGSQRSNAQENGR